jgi:hypothetical protein
MFVLMLTSHQYEMSSMKKKEKKYVFRCTEIPKLSDHRQWRRNKIFEGKPTGSFLTL